jgi:hypothetical protein
MSKLMDGWIAIKRREKICDNFLLPPPSRSLLAAAEAAATDDSVHFAIGAIKSFLNA